MIPLFLFLLCLTGLGMLAVKSRSSPAKEVDQVELEESRKSVSST